MPSEELGPDAAMARGSRLEPTAPLLQWAGRAFALEKHATAMGNL